MYVELIATLAQRLDAVRSALQPACLLPDRQSGIILLALAEELHILGEKIEREVGDAFAE